MFEFETALDVKSEGNFVNAHKPGLQPGKSGLENLALKKMFFALKYIDINSS